MSNISFQKLCKLSASLQVNSFIGSITHLYKFIERYLMTQSGSYTRRVVTSSTSITKHEVVETITAKEYSLIFKQNRTQMTLLEKRVAHSLNGYQSSIQELSLELQKSQEKLWELHSQKNELQMTPQQPFDEEQLLFSKGNTFKDNQEKLQELADVIDSKLEKEDMEQTQFISILKEEYEKDERNQERGLFLLDKWVGRKMVKPFSLGFKAIMKDEKMVTRAIFMKNIVTNMVHLLEHKAKDEKQHAFRCIWKEVQELNKTDPGLNVKGRLLLGLKEYPRQSKKNAFYYWYIKSTVAGQALLQKASNKLVLYTNVNKTTAFYRLFNLVKGKKKIVSPKMKRMTIMLFLYTKVFVERKKQEFFEKFKMFASREKAEINVAGKMVESSRKRMKEVFRRWHEAGNKMKVRGQKLRYIYRLLYKTKTGRIIDGWSKWKSLPERSNFKNNQKAHRFQKELNKFIDRTLTKALKPFKNQFQQGQTIKKKAAIQMIEETKNSQRKMYERWVKIVEQYRQINKCKMVLMNFEQLNKTIKSVADNAFSSTLESKMKEDAIWKIYANQHFCMESTFRSWIERNRREKAREQKVCTIKTSYMSKLIMSKSGSVMIAYNKIKNLPERNNRGRSEKANKFEAGLRRYINRTLGKAIGGFKKEFELGQAAKKRAVIQLIETTMGGQKRLYQRWMSLTEKTRLINECRLIGSVFTSLNFVIKSVTDNAFGSNKANQLKIDAFNQIFSNMNSSLSNSLKRWREVNQFEKLIERMDSRKKEMCIDTLMRCLNNGSQRKIRDAIDKFRTHRKLTEIQRNFMKRLLMSKAGLVVIGLKKWQSLPERNNRGKNEKANKFEAGLRRYINRTLGKAIGGFKKEFELGQAAKKRAVIQLIETTMGGQKRLYQRWMSLTEKTRLINECRLIGSVFTSLNFVIKSVTDNAFGSNKANQLKIDAFNQIFSNMNSSLSNSLKRWREVNQFEKLIERMDSRKKEMCIDTLMRCLNNGSQRKIRDAIDKFKTHRKLTEIQRNFMKRLLMSKAGLVVIGLKKWQSLPERNNRGKNEKANKFEAGLRRYINRTLGKAIGGFKKEFELGQAAKKRAVIQLIETTMGGQKRLYQRWMSLTEKTRLINECRLIGSVFTSLNFVIKSVTDNAFGSNKANQLKIDAFNQIFSNMNSSLSNSLKRWREVNQFEKLIERMDSRKKEMCIDTLMRCLNNGSQRKIRDAIDKFRRNKNVLQIQRNFMRRLLMTKVGLLFLSVKRWQGLPERSHKGHKTMASKFEAGLKRFTDRTLHRAFGSFKHQFDSAQTIKKRSVIQILNATTSGQKRTYMRWLEQVHSYRTFSQFKGIASIFSHCSKSLNNTLEPILLPRKKAYTLEQIQTIQAYFVRFMTARKQNGREAVHVLHKHYLKQKKNPWFKKAAQSLALKTRINSQKSFWRLKYHMYSSGLIYHTALIIKLKKLFNNVRKYYQLNMYKVFLTIDKYGKYKQQVGANRERQERMSMIAHKRHAQGTRKMELPVHHNHSASMIHREEYVFEREQVMIVDHQTTNIIEGRGTINQASAARAAMMSRGISVGIMDRIFKRNVKKYISKWRKGISIQGGGLERAVSMMRERSDQYQFISRMGAIEAITRITKTMYNRLKLKTLGQVCSWGMHEATDSAYDRSLDERLQLINRQNVLMQEVRSYKRENQQLGVQMQNKQRCLRDCNQTVTLLSLRINYMITQKFVALLEKSYEGIQFRRVNDAFDCIVDEANANYEREEMMHDFE